MIHVFIGTKAQYVKTAPVLRRLDQKGVPYNLIDSGQHAGLSPGLRRELRIREPDVCLRRGHDLSSVPAVAAWMLGTLIQAVFRPAWVRRTLFRGCGGICLVHGDTPSTLLAVCLARRAGLKVAHLEAGLRSHDYLHPFPEELIRVLVMRRADILFAPSDWAHANLVAMRLRGHAVNLGANTNVESLQFSLGQNSAGSPFGAGYRLVAIHRVETLHNRRRLRRIVDLVVCLAAQAPTVFVLHPPTEAVLRRRGSYELLERTAGLRLTPLLPHADFVRAIRAADFVVTDGGSVQEECSYLGVPCLIMRRRTERLDGLNENACLSCFDDGRIAHFVEHWREFTRPGIALGITPSEMIVKAIGTYAEASGETPLRDLR